MEQINLNHNYTSINNKFFMSKHNKYGYGLEDTLTEYNNIISRIHKSNLSFFKLPPLTPININH